MKLVTVSSYFMDVNTYLISSEKGAIIIDPAEMCEEIKEFISQNKGKETAIFLTHNHFDHIMGVADVKELSGSKVYIAEADADGLSDPAVNLSERFCLECKPCRADVTFNDGDEFIIGDIKGRVMVTPGHSKGSACFVIGDWLFSGDTLFRLSVGRTDFLGGDRAEQINSLLRLSAINGDYDVYPGHGPATRLSFEKQNNPYIKEIL